MLPTLFAMNKLLFKNIDAYLAQLDSTSLLVLTIVAHIPRKCRNIKKIFARHELSQINQIFTHMLILGIYQLFKAVNILCFVHQCVTYGIKSRKSVLRGNVVLRCQGKPEDPAHMINDEYIEYIPLEKIRKEWFQSQDSGNVEEFDERAALMSYLLKRQSEEEDDDDFYNLSEDFMDEHGEIWVKQDLESVGDNDDDAQSTEIKNPKDSWIAPSFVDSTENDTDDENYFTSPPRHGLSKGSADVWNVSHDDKEILAVGMSSDFMNQLSEKIFEAKKRKAPKTGVDTKNKKKMQRRECNLT